MLIVVQDTKGDKKETEAWEELISGINQALLVCILYILIDMQEQMPWNSSVFFCMRLRESL